MTIPVLLVIIHGAVAGNIENFYSAPLCFLAGGIKIKRWLGEHHQRRDRQRGLGWVPRVHQVCHHVHQLHGLVRDLDGGVGGDRDHRLLRSQPWTGRRTRAVRSLDVALRRRSLALTRRAGWSGCLVAGRSSTVRVSLFQGPISRATGGVDFSWLASIVFGGLAYWLLCRSEPHLVSAPSLASRDGGEVGQVRSTGHET